jgi:hypothetical protein
MSNFNIASSLYKHGIISDAEMEKHVDKALNDKTSHPAEVDRLLQHPTITPDSIDKVLMGHNYFHKHRVIQHPNATKENLEKAMLDKDLDIADFARYQKIKRKL